MATLIERMKALLAESEEQEEEEQAPAGADTSAMQQENTQLKERIAELEEQRTDHEALFTRVLDHLEVADDAEGEADGEPEASQTAQEEPQETQEEPVAQEPTQAEQPQQTHRRQPRRAPSRTAARNVRATPNFDTMSLEERAAYVDDVLDPADKAGRQV